MNQRVSLTKSSDGQRNIASPVSVDSKPETPKSLPKLAILSTYGELCGIASYTFFLKRQLQEKFDVTVIPLNQYMLRGTDARLVKLGDQHIDEICDRLKDFDYVNIQLEYGTFGARHGTIFARLKKVIRAADRLSITFHTISQRVSLERRGLLLNLIRLKAGAVIKQLRDARGDGFTDRMAALIRQQQRKGKNISVVVHTRREARMMSLLYGIKNVYDHPLAFLPKTDAVKIRQKASRDEFPLLRNVPKDARFVGVFGFMTPYKNTQLVLRAMEFLPKDYHLLVFGAVHPNEIKRFRFIDPYLEKIMGDSHMGVAPADNLSDFAKESGLQLTTDLPADLFKREKGPLWDRVHFLGARDDPDFFKGMCLCESVVLPYVEVGQTSSGPISQAVELGCRVLAARNKAFMEFAKYFDRRVEFFDLGNYVELAKLIESSSEFDLKNYEQSYTTATNCQVYAAANSKDYPKLRLGGEVTEQEFVI